MIWILWGLIVFLLILVGITNVRINRVILIQIKIMKTLGDNVLNQTITHKELHNYLSSKGKN